MTEATPSIDARELEAAFALFSEASSQLASAYTELQGRVDRLAQELAVANGELRRQYLEKEALSERLRLLLDALPGGVVVLDGNGLVVEANPAARRWLGEQLTGLAWSAVARQLVPVAGTTEWALDTGGETKRLTLSESPLDAGGGRILLLNDVTEADRLRRQLEHHKRLSAMGEMAAGLAHQLRTPLATALLHTANLGRPDLADADRAKFSERLRERLRHLETMIQNMLQFVRGQPVGTEPVSLDAVVQEVAQIIEPQLHGGGLRFEREFLAPGIAVRGDRKALTGALLNLLENALQMTPRGGTVRLSGGVHGDVVSILVTDTGPGMDPEVKSRVFEPFYTTRKEGTGLGLAIVRSVAQAHGGEVEVNSTPGQGSVFTIHLPIARKAA